MNEEEKVFNFLINLNKQKIENINEFKEKMIETLIDSKQKNGNSNFIR